VTSLQLVANQQLVIEEVGGRNLIHLRNSEGRTSLTIEVTSSGPVLRFDGPGLTIESTGALALSAETIALHARDGLSLSSGGDASIHVKGDLETSARVQKIRAALGNVELEANDDVRVVGERILLNC
jgi:uncharacterized protein (DUF2345 family)